MPLNGKKSEALSLYFHVPFCSKKCPYCHFYVIKENALLKKRYLSALKKEWEQKAPLLEGKNILSVYFGGGTPSVLDIKDFEYIFSFLSLRTENMEITVEANPEKLHLSFIQELRNLGVNRISLGVQSFDDTLLKKIGRTHDAKKAIESIFDIAKAGIENLSIDLMYDLPEQTFAIFEKTLQQAIALPITHISLYNLTVEPNTAFYRKKRELQKKMPKDEESFLMLDKAISLFTLHHFNRYEISAFAKKGYHSRHNSGYWLGRSFLGYGPSAFSYFEGSRFSNVSDLIEYEKRLNNGKSPCDFSETLEPNAHYKELLAIRLRFLADHLSLSDFNEHIPKDTSLVLQKLLDQEYIRESAGKICLTDKGTLFYDTVAEELVS